MLHNHFKNRRLSRCLECVIFLYIYIFQTADLSGIIMAQSKTTHDSATFRDLPTEMCLEVPRKKYVNMGKKAV